jgi:hypothetical protein
MSIDITYKVGDYIEFMTDLPYLEGLPATGKIIAVDGAKILTNISGREEDWCDTSKFKRVMTTIHRRTGDDLFLVYA